jgi:hypothetical protein
MNKIHIATIDFPLFFKDFFDDVESANKFYDQLTDLPPDKNAAKLVFHQAARMVWLADQIDVVARARPAFQILFYLIAAELVAKITFAYQGEGESKKYVRRFFAEICSERTRTDLGTMLNRTPYGTVTADEAVLLLYKIRCDVVHEGMYYGFQLPEKGQEFSEMIEIDGKSFTTHMPIDRIREMVLEGAVLASEKLLSTARTS